MTRLLLCIFFGLPTLITTVAYVRLWRRHPSDPDTDPIPVLAAIAAFVAECAATIALVLTWPFGWLPFAENNDLPGDRVIVLVPGSFLNRAAVWLLRARLQSRDWPVVTCVDTALFTLDGQQHALASVLAHVSGLDRAVSVVAFGRGGRAARVHLAHNRYAGVDRLITIGMRHRITPPEPGDEESLGTTAPTAVDRLPYEMEVVAISSDFDALVPAAAAYYPGAFNIEVRGVGHVSLLASRRVFDLLIENIAHSEVHSGESI